MKKTYAFIIALALSASLVFSQTPWQDHLNDLKSQAEGGDADAIGKLADTMSDLGSKNFLGG